MGTSTWTGSCVHCISCRYRDTQHVHQQPTFCIGSIFSMLLYPYIREHRPCVCGHFHWCDASLSSPPSPVFGTYSPRSDSYILPHPPPSLQPLFCSVREHSPQGLLHSPQKQFPFCHWSSQHRVLWVCVLCLTLSVNSYGSTTHSPTTISTFV